MLSVVSCKTNKIEDSSETISDDPEMIFQLKKSPCYGECPVYVFQVFNNKTGFYRGMRYVDKIGDFTTELSDQEFTNLLETLDRINFDQLEDKYINKFILDMPSTTINYRDYKVEYQYSLAPQQLIQLTEDIEKMINALQWVKTQSTYKS